MTEEMKQNGPSGIEAVQGDLQNVPANDLPDTEPQRTAIKDETVASEGYYASRETTVEHELEVEGNAVKFNEPIDKIAESSYEEKEEAVASEGYDAASGRTNEGFVEGTHFVEGK